MSYGSQPGRAVKGIKIKREGGCVDTRAVSGRLSSFYFSSYHTISFFVVTELVNENLPVVELENRVQFGAETEKKK